MHAARLLLLLLLPPLIGGSYLVTPSNVLQTPAQARMTTPSPAGEQARALPKACHHPSALDPVQRLICELLRGEAGVVTTPPPDWVEEDFEAHLVTLIWDLAEGDEHARLEAAYALFELQPQWVSLALPELCEALDDESENVRRVAAEILAALGPRAEPAVPALLEAIRDPRRGELAGWAISRVGQPAVKGLEQTLRWPEPTARSAAAYALGAIGCKAASARASLRRARRDSSFHVRRQAALALRRLSRCKAASPGAGAAPPVPTGVHTRLR